MSRATANTLYRNSWLGNASTDYADKNATSHVIPDASDVVRTVLTAPDYEVCFTSGASEGNNYVFRSIVEVGPGPIHVITSAIEHKSSLRCVEHLVQLGHVELTIIQPTMDGVIDPVAVAEAVRPNTRLISIMHMNNETGAINNLKEIGKVAKAYNIVFHTDAAQSFCKLPINAVEMHLDIITTSMHKVYGPIGLGAIVLSPRVAKWGIAQISGTQYNGLRGGTENLAAIAACRVAILDTVKDRPRKNTALMRHKCRILSALRSKYDQYQFHQFYGAPENFIPSESSLQAIGHKKTKIGFTILGDPAQSHSGTLLISIFKIGDYDIEDRFCNVKLKQALFDRSIIISIGSACNTKVTGPSHVLTALKAPFVIRSGVIRISLLDSTKSRDVEYLIKNLIECIESQN